MGDSNRGAGLLGGGRDQLCSLGVGAGQRRGDQGGCGAGPGGQLGPRGAGTGDGRSTVWLGDERGVRGLGRSAGWALSEVPVWALTLCSGDTVGRTGLWESGRGALAWVNQRSSCPQTTGGAARSTRLEGWASTPSPLALAVARANRTAAPVDGRRGTEDTQAAGSISPEENQSSRGIYCVDSQEADLCPPRTPSPCYPGSCLPGHTIPD